MTRKKQKPAVIDKPIRRLVISLDKGTIMFILSLLSALGVTGAGTFFASGKADEAKAGSDIQVQDTWTATRDNLVKLATATKALATKMDELQRDNESLKQAINQIQQRQGTKPVFQVKGKDEDGIIESPVLDPDSLPKTIQFPQIDRVQARLKDQENKS